MARRGFRPDWASTFGGFGWQSLKFHTVTVRFLRSVHSGGPSVGMVARPGTQPDCDACAIAPQLASEGRLYPLGEHWTVNARLHHQRPALIVAVRNHRRSILDLTGDEMTSLGMALRAASAELWACAGVGRVYVNLWNETGDGHVHFHVVPRFASESELIGPRLVDLLPEVEHLDAESAAAAAAALFRAAT